MKRILVAIVLATIIFLSSCAPARVGVGINTRPYYGRPYYRTHPYYNPYNHGHVRSWSRPHYNGHYRY